MIDIDIGRLPFPKLPFIRRENDLAVLDAAWERSHTHIFTLEAFGGLGKSALVSHWLGRLAKDGWRGAERVFGWSFNGQSTKGEPGDSAEPFLNYALGFFGDPHPGTGLAYDRGQRLAKLIQGARSLLLLDSVEALQYQSGPKAGDLRDPGLWSLLVGLAAANPGLCVVTTRVHLGQLDTFSYTAPYHRLENLSIEDGVELLKQLGLQGQDFEMSAIVEEMDGHPLTLSLTGEYLRARGGNIQKWREIDLGKADERHGGRAFQVIASYALQLGSQELEILRLFGLIGRRPDVRSLNALRATPSIAGLTDQLVDLTDEDWDCLVWGLRQQRLLATPADNNSADLEIHPLVHAYFKEELEERCPEAWKAGHLRLYEHLCQTAPDLPDNFIEMQPLYAAVAHGCQAGRHQEALDEVYWRRIQRGSEYFSTYKLSAMDTVRSTLANFFEHPWGKPATSLSPASQAFVLNEAGAHLGSLGRVSEALKPTQRAMDRAIGMADWENASVYANNLTDLAQTLGRLDYAVELGRKNLEFADRSGNDQRFVSSRGRMADALHQYGKREESALFFREAEAKQAEKDPYYHQLYSVWGFKYCDLLLGQAEPIDGAGLDGIASCSDLQRMQQAYHDVVERARKQQFEWRLPSDSLLDVALDNLTFGRASLGLALASVQPVKNENFAQATEGLNQAVQGLRDGSIWDYLPQSLTSRAALRRFQFDFENAASDLAEALEITQGGSMRLHECDVHLEWARLSLQQDNIAAVHMHVAKARELVSSTGYGRREREVIYLERRLSVLPLPVPVLTDTAPVLLKTPDQEENQVKPEKKESPLPPAIFISYSHDDEEWKDRLVEQLKVLEFEGEFEVWDDARIKLGDKWLPAIKREMERAKVAVLLVSADFLISKFIRSTEVPSLLARQQAGGLHVIPVIVHPCPWQGVPWLASIQLWPRDGRPLSMGTKSQIDTDLAALALEISKLLKG